MRVRLFGTGLLPASARRPRLLKNACLETLRKERKDRSGEISIVFLSRRRMLSLNKKFLRHSHDTDVIAFPYGSGPARMEAEDVPYGDIFISAWQARRQAREIGHSVLAEVLTLIVHGTLHLLGHEDSSPRKRATMFRRQGEILGPLTGSRNL